MFRLDITSGALYAHYTKRTIIILAIRTIQAAPSLPCNPFESPQEDTPEQRVNRYLYCTATGYFCSIRCYDCRQGVCMYASFHSAIGLNESVTGKGGFRSSIFRDYERNKISPLFFVIAA
jgi:hypothetical protein